MIVEVPAVLAGIRTALDLLKALAPGNTETHDVRRHLLDAQEAITEQRDEIRRLEGELEDIKRFKKEEMGGFQRSTITGRLGAVLPCYKEVDGDGTPYCANCFENFKKSILFCSSVANSRMFSYSCVSCGLKIDRL